MSDIEKLVAELPLPPHLDVCIHHPTYGWLPVAKWKLGDLLTKVPPSSKVDRLGTMIYVGEVTR